MDGYDHSTKLLYTISNNIEVYKESVPQTKNISHCAVKFEASEENRIVHEKFVLEGVVCASIRSSGWVRGQEIYVIFFMTYFYWARGAMTPSSPLDPLLCPEGVGTS